MRPTAELKILGCRRTIQRIRDDVMELEKTTLAASTIFADKRALSAVPLPHLASDRSRDVTRSFS